MEIKLSFNFSNLHVKEINYMGKKTNENKYIVCKMSHLKKITKM